MRCFPASLSAATVVAIAALVPLLLTCAPNAHAQANLTFSGGGDSPLSVTLAAPVTYTITRPSGVSQHAPYFIFDAVGGAAMGGSVTGTISFSVNGGISLPIDTIGMGGSGGNSITVDDLIFIGMRPFLAVSDVVTLTAGTLTMDVTTGITPPSDGSFTTFMADGNVTRISSNGVAGSIAVPEPGSVALLGSAGVLPLSGVVARRRRRHA